MVVAEWIAFAVGVALVVITFASVTTTLIVPRNVTSKLTTVIGKVCGNSFLFLARRGRHYEARDRILSFLGPAFLVALLIVWVGLLFVSFALMFWPFTGSFSDAVVASGSSMFTLGFATPHGAGPIALTFGAAASGLIVVALEIAYLPVVYAAFNRRETLVTMLESRGGSPSWGPEILARHALIVSIDSLGPLYARWEEWAADVAESHTTYRVLPYFRSPDPMRSWVLGLLSILDAAAMQMAVNPTTFPPQARPLLRMGYIAFREIAAGMGIAVNRDPHPDDPIQLTREDFDAALEHLRKVGWTFERTPDDGWIHFRGWRVNYESAAYGLADAIDAPPALWSGRRSRFDGLPLAPRRPPHRSPSDERALVAQEAELKRSHTDGS